MKKTKNSIAVLVICAAASLLTAAPGSATAGKAHRPLPVLPGSEYLALGDSVTFGFMEPGVMPAPNYHDPSSFAGYPEQVGAALHLTVANAACPGETSASLINPNAPSNGCEDSPAGSRVGHYRPQLPLHVKYPGSQLAYALRDLRARHDVRLVSLMIGADDYFLCTETTKDGCASQAEQTSAMHRLASNVRTILSAIRNRVDYTGQIAIVNYYSLNYASRTISAIPQAVNRTVDSAAKPFGVEIADGYRELRAATLRSGGNTCAAGLLTQLGTPGDCGIHPSYAGQAILALALETAIRP